MSIVQEKMYMDVDDVCAILGVSKAYAVSRCFVPAGASWQRQRPPARR